IGPVTSPPAATLAQPPVSCKNLPVGVPGAGTSPLRVEVNKFKKEVTWAAVRFSSAPSPAESLPLILFVGIVTSVLFPLENTLANCIISDGSTATELCWFQYVPIKNLTRAAPLEEISTRSEERRVGKAHRAEA